MSEMPSARARRDAGFSMVEMLMAAFILAIGLLGLTMLQAMSVRVAAGGHNLEMAVQLAEQVMDQVEAEGRATYLNSNITDQTTPGSLSTLTYIKQDKVEQYFRLPAPTELDPVTTKPYPPGKPILSTSANYKFYVKMTQAYVAGTGLADITVQTQFSDVTNAVTNAPILRTVQITRRILHG